MGEGYRFEILFREIMNCDNRETLLTFGGIINAGSMEDNEGGLYDAIIAVLGSIYPRVSYEICHKIDVLIDYTGKYRNNFIYDIPENELNKIYNDISDIINDDLFDDSDFR